MRGLLPARRVVAAAMLLGAFTAPAFAMSLIASVDIPSPDGRLVATVDIQNGEYKTLDQGIGIFAAKNGMPIAGGQIEPAQLLRLLRETRRAA